KLNTSQRRTAGQRGAARRNPPPPGRLLDLVDLPLAALHEVVVALHDLRGLRIRRALAHHLDVLVERLDFLLPHDRPELFAAHVGHHADAADAGVLHQRLHLLEPLHHLAHFARLAVHQLANDVHRTLLSIYTTLRSVGRTHRTHEAAWERSAKSLALHHVTRHRLRL